MNPEAQLPIVYQTAANLYQAELFSLQLQGGRVRHVSDFYSVHMDVDGYWQGQRYTCIYMRTHTLCRQQFSDPVFYVFQSGLSHEELSVAVEMLSAVAVLNEVLDTKDPQAVIEQLTDSPLGFTNIDQDNLNR